MFNLSGSEVLFLLVAGLVVLGPERLPGVIRRAGRLYGDLRRAVSGIEKDLRETFAEPVEEIRGTLRTATVAFGEVDDEPSPPMRPELSAPVAEPGHENDAGERGDD